MADEKIEVRDMNAPDEKPYLTKPNAQVDLERRLDPEHTPESQVGNTVTVNPNPFGDGEYVGTDPIYQNYANDQNKPLAAEDGVEAKALKDLQDQHEVADDEAVEDFGLGGKARRTLGNAGPTRAAAEADENTDADDDEVEDDEDEDENPTPQQATRPTPPTPTSPAQPQSNQQS